MALTSPRFAGNLRLQQASENLPVMRQGETSDAVILLQDALIDLGFPMPNSTKNGESLPDGIFGQETKKTVTDFQGQQGLIRDGVPGRNTLHTLDRLFQHEREYYLFPLARYMDGWSTSTSSDKRK